MRILCEFFEKFIKLKVFLIIPESSYDYMKLFKQRCPEFKISKVFLFLRGSKTNNSIIYADFYEQVTLPPANLTWYINQKPVSKYISVITYDLPLTISPAAFSVKLAEYFQIPSRPHPAK